MVAVMFRRCVAALLAMAARGWPDERRAELVREWEAELHVIEHESGRSAVVRAWRRFWFAGSLTLARRTGIGGVVGGGANVDGMLWQAAGLFLVPFVPAVLSVVTLGILDKVMARLLGGSTVASAATLVAGSVSLVVVAAWIGYALAERLMVRRGGVAVPLVGRLAAFVPLLAGVAAAGAVPAPRGSYLAAGGIGLASVLVGVCTLGLLLVPVSVAAVGVGRRVRSRIVRALLVVPVSAAVALVSVTVTVWRSAERPSWAGGNPWWWVEALIGFESRYAVSKSAAGLRVIELVLDRLPAAMLVAAAVMFVYTVRVARPGARSSAAPRSRPDASPVAEPGQWWPATLLAGAAYCAVAWAVTLTYLTPHIGTRKSGADVLGAGLLEPWPGWSKGRVWMQDMQLCAILCAVLFFLCAAAYRGLPLVPGLVAGVALLGGDIVVVRLGLLRLWLLPWLVVGALGIGYVAWRWALRLGRANPSIENWGRPLVVFVSVLAASLVPAPHSGWTAQGVTPATPPALVMVVVGLPTLLAMLAATGIVTTSRRRALRSAWALPVVAGLASAALASVRLYVPWPTDILNTGDGWRTVLCLAPALPLAWITYALISGRPRHPTVLGLIALGVAVLALPLTFVSLLSGMLLARTVLAPMRYGETFDAIPYLPSVVMVGLILAILAHRDTIRSANPIAESPPVPA